MKRSLKLRSFGYTGCLATREPDIAALPFTAVDDVRDIVERFAGHVEEAFHELHGDVYEVSELSDYRETTGHESRFRVVTETWQGANTGERIRTALASNPELTDRELAAIVGCSSSTVNKWRKRIEQQLAA